MEEGEGGRRRERVGGSCLPLTRKIPQWKFTGCENLQNVDISYMTIQQKLIFLKTKKFNIGINGYADISAVVETKLKWYSTTKPMNIQITLEHKYIAAQQKVH